MFWLGSLMMMFLCVNAVSTMRKHLSDEPFTWLGHLNSFTYINATLPISDLSHPMQPDSPVTIHILFAIFWFLRRKYPLCTKYMYICYLSHAQHKHIYTVLSTTWWWWWCALHRLLYIYIYMDFNAPKDSYFLVLLPHQKLIFVRIKWLDGKREIDVLQEVKDQSAFRGISDTYSPTHTYTHTLRH